MKVLMAYPGGKRLTSRVILPILRHPMLRNLEYREPFAGGMSVGIGIFETARPGVGWVNDIDRGVYALWCSVKLFPDQLGAGVRRFRPSDDSFETLKQFFANPIALTAIPEIVEMAVNKLAIHKLSFGGLGEMGNSCDSKTHQWNAKAICALIDRIHPTLKGVQVSNLDFMNVIRDESKNAILYNDPPYVLQSRQLYRNNFEMADHVRLRNALQTTPHEWLVSYDDVPEVRALYSWAHIERIPVVYTLKGARRTHELLIGKRDYRNKS